MQVFLLVLLPSLCNAQFVAGIKSSPSLYLGYNSENIVLSIGGDFEYRSTESEYNGPYDSDEYTNSIFTFTPSINIKFFINKKKLSPYLYFSIGKEIPISVSAKYNGIKDKDQKKILEDQNDEINARSALGLEYFLDESISVGGEIGLRAHPFKYKYSDYSKVSSFQLNSYSSLTFNYYF